jgi:uncharacterized protein
MAAQAFWNALYTQGHDAARLIEAGEGWRLDGFATFLRDGVPAGLHYQLLLAPDWSTRIGRIDGLFGAELVTHHIARTDDGWLLDGVHQPGLDGAVDLDFGFTPATNHPQLRRLGLAVGEARELTVAWFDLGAARLVPLRQLYARVEHDAYAYESPRDAYRATLRIAADGFVLDYPALWQGLSRSARNSHRRARHRPDRSSAGHPPHSAAHP